MGVNLIFLGLYASLGGIFPADDLYLILVLQCLVGVYLIYKNEANPINPLFLYYVVTMMQAIADINLMQIVGTSKNVMYRYIIPQCIEEATRLTCIGQTLIFIGFQAAKKLSFPSVSKDVKNKNVYIALYYILVFILCNSLFFNVFRSSGIKVIDNSLKLINFSLIIIFTRFWAYEKNNKYRNYAIVIVVLQTLYALTYSYTRTDLITPSVCFFIGYFLAVGVRKVFTVQIIPAVIVILVFVNNFSNLGNSRSHFIDAFVPKQNINAVKEKMDQIDEMDDEDSHAGFFIRIANLAQVTNVVNLVNKNGFYNGRASAPLLVALIPRDLYPDKPIINLGAWFALEIGVAIKNDKSTSRALITNNSVDMEIWGELYLDFGYVGVVFGCFLAGLIFAMFWNSTHFYSSVYNLTGTLFGGYLLFQGMSGIGPDLQVFVTLLSTYIIIYILSRLL